MRRMTTPKHSAVVTNAYVNEAAVLRRDLRAAWCAALRPGSPSSRSGRRGTRGYSPVTSLTGAVNGVKGERETNHTKELRKTSSKINRYRIIN